MEAMSCLVAGALLITAPWFTLVAGEPEEAVAKLESHWKAGGGSFSTAYWKFSGELAAKYGAILVPPILAKVHDWKDEEGLIYVPLIVQMRGAEAKSVLEKYRDSKDQTESIWAKEFLTEIESYETAKREGRPYQ